MKKVNLISILILMISISAVAKVINISPSDIGNYASNTFAQNFLPGDTILFAPGDYGVDVLRCHYTYVDGTAENPIVVRAAKKGTVNIIPKGPNGQWWIVRNKYYIFENLSIDQNYSIHSFHVKNGTKFLIIRNCHFFGLKNAPLKVSSDITVDEPLASHVVFENNESDRAEGPWPNSSVLNGCNIDNGDYHVIRGCYMHDISMSDSPSFWLWNGTYGGFIKTGSRYSIIENNIVKNMNGYGLGLGGGTTGIKYMSVDRRPVESFGCIVRNNVIVGPADRKAGNHAISINYANDNLIYNNTIINASPIAIMGNYRDSLSDEKGIDFPGPNLTACGVGNVVMNNLSVNLFNIDSLWYEVSYGQYKNEDPLLIQGIQYIKAFTSWPMSQMRDSIWANLNTTVNNLRISDVDANDIFVDTANNDYRIKDGALDAYGRGKAVVSTDTNVQKLGQTFGINYLSGIDSNAYLNNPIDMGGNTRHPINPGFGAYEYNSPEIGIEDDPNLKKIVSTDFAKATISPNPVGLVGTNIEFKIEANLPHLEITIWNARGQMIYGMYHGEINKGEYNKHWNGYSNAGNKMSPGTYFVRFRSGQKHFTKKINLIK